MARRTGKGNWGQILLRLVIVLIIVVGGYAVAAPFFEIGGVVVPRAEIPPTRQIPQGWKPEVTSLFHRQIAGDKNHAPRMVPWPSSSRS